MMEPVAKKRVRLPDIGEELFEHYPFMSAQTHEAAVKGYARKALSDAEARIAELETRLVVMTSARDHFAKSYGDAEARAEATEALLKEAGKAMGIVLGNSKRVDMHNNGALSDIVGPWYMDQLRAIHDKIGGGE